MTGKVIFNHPCFIAPNLQNRNGILLRISGPRLHNYAHCGKIASRLNYIVVQRKSIVINKVLSLLFLSERLF